jgi:hypothetical protein
MTFEHYEPYDDKAALRSQIASTRADLGQTIEELAWRTDVRARAVQMVSDVRTRAGNAVRSRARSGASSVRQGLGRVKRGPASLLAGAGAGALAGYCIYDLLQRRRGRR